MANAASKCLFLFFLSLLSCCSSGTLVGFSYHASGNTAVSSPGRTLSFLKQNKINPSQIRVFVDDPRVLSTLSKTGVAVDLYLNERQVENIISSESSSKSWLKTHILPFISQVDIKSIVAIRGNDDTRKSSLPRVLSSLKTLHSVLTSLPFDRRIKVSVAFSLSFLENLRRGNERDLHSICSFINEVKSVVIEANIDKELSMGDKFVRSMIEKAGLAHSVLTCSEVPMVLTIKSPAVPNTTEVAQFADKVSKALENETQIASRLVGLYAEVECMEDFAQKELKREEEQIFPSSSRELLSDLHPKTTSHDAYGSPTIFPTNSTPPLPTTSPYNSSPNNVTVPATNPVTITPVNPAPPVEVSSATPPPSNPVSPPLPVTNPATAPPTTNPATTYPPPPGGVPSTTQPVTNPVTPPSTSNAPAVPGQSWCVAKSGAPQAALQAALDYACGMGGIDCSQIQQGGSCYDPNSLQNHASYAFNSYYQKHPVSTSCDFGGVATMVSANPSTGSCIYASSSSSSTPTTPTSNQTTTNPPPPSTILPPPSTIPPPTSPTPNQTTTNPPPPSTIPPPPSTIPPPTSPTPNQTTTHPPPPPSTIPPPTLTIPPPPSTIPSPTSTIPPPSSPTPNQTTTNPPPPSTIPPPTLTIPPPTSTTPPPTPTRNQTTTNPPPTSTTPPPTSTIPPPTSAPTPAITSFPPPGEGVFGFGTPPSGLNSSNPTPSGTMPEFEPDSPPGFNTSISTSASLQPTFGCIFFGTALVTRNIFLNM